MTNQFTDERVEAVGQAIRAYLRPERKGSGPLYLDHDVHEYENLARAALEADAAIGPQESSETSEEIATAALYEAEPEFRSDSAVQLSKALYRARTAVGALQVAGHIGRDPMERFSQVTEDMVRNFKAGWHQADIEGDAGNRVKRGLQIVMDSVYAKPSAPVTPSERPYCPIHGDLLAGQRSERYRAAGAGHERLPATVNEEAIEAALRKVLDGQEAMHCTRTWEAWGHGTMTEDDFVNVTDDAAAVAEIVKAISAAIEVRQ